MPRPGNLTAIVLLLCGSILLSSCAGVQPPAPPTQPNPADILEEDGRLAAQVETAQQRAWILGQIAARLGRMDPERAAKVYTESMSAARQSSSNGEAIRARAAELRRLSETWSPDNRTSALALADRLEALAGRAWVMRVIATEWRKIDPDGARDALNAAAQLAMQNPDSRYRDLDLRGIAVELATIDLDNALKLTDRIHNPFVQVWALREMNQLPRAIAMARQMTDPYDRAWALQEIALASDSGDAPRILLEAADAAFKVDKVEPKSFALSDIASALAKFTPARAESLSDQIDANVPEARFTALRDVAVATKSAQIFSRAQREVARIPDDYEQAKAMQSLASKWTAVDPQQALALARQIADPFVRADVERDSVAALAQTNLAQALEEAKNITLPSSRLEALTAIGAVLVKTDAAQAGQVFNEAFGLAKDLTNMHPLVALASEWARVAPDKAMLVVDKLDSDADRAQSLCNIAVVWVKSHKAHGIVAWDNAVAAAKRIRDENDPFASSKALIELAQAWSTIDQDRAAQVLSEALEAAEKVSTKS
ncbi:MAG: hypothetical protein M1136_09260 [Chloroflexi bacterium]|nr:hypothetical protein [Chloroflexota bacterium]